MKISPINHGMGVLLLELVVLWRGMVAVGAQPSPPGGGFGQYPYTTPFTPSIAVIIIILVGALFFMVFLSIYIRRCSDGASAGSSIRHALSFRSRRTVAARGLDRAVVESFPTFSYSEVKDHKIGKGVLECAVCLNEFDDNETLRLLPKCDHVFHPECIDAWLESHVTCPVCRANLASQPEESPAPASEPVENANPESRNDEIAIQVDGNQTQPPPASVNRNRSFELPTFPARSWSIRRPRVFGYSKFRSHSTGHSLVQPGENLDRFTLRLPEEVRKEVMDRAYLNRTRSWAAELPREGSSRRGYRTGGGEGSSRAGRFYRRLDQSDRGTKSDRWVFLTRGFSMRSTKVVAETSGGGGSGRTPVRMPSIRFLEPMAADRTGSLSDDPNRNPV